MNKSLLLNRFRELGTVSADSPALIDARGKVSFGALHARARSVASMLVARGLSGRRIALLSPASRDWFVAFWGILLAGSSVVPLAEVHPTREHLSALANSKAAGLVLAGGLGSELASAGAGHDAHVIEYEALETAGEIEALPEALGADDAVIFFTSGTTGTPKAARLSHDQLAHMARMVANAWGITSSDRLVHCLPLHHMHGLGIAYLVCHQAGAAVHLLGRFEPHAVWEALAHGSVFMAVPTIHKRMLDEFRAAPKPLQERWRKSAQALSLVTSGSAALPVGLAEAWAEVAGRVPLERFGMTEVGVALSNPLDAERVVGSAGQPLPGMHVRIVDDGGQDVKPGQAGEIWIRGPSVFSGYDDEQQTREAFSSDGWFKSGDTALWLEREFVKILGRTSVDIIKSGGYKLSALEIEEALRDHPGVDDAAVVGVEDATWGEAVVAVLIASSVTSEDAVREFLKSRLAPYKVPKTFRFVAELPRNLMGKVDKQKLKTDVAGRVGGDGDRAS